MSSRNNTPSRGTLPVFINQNPRDSPSSLTQVQNIAFVQVLCSSKEVDHVTSRSIPMSAMIVSQSQLLSSPTSIISHTLRTICLAGLMFPRLLYA